MVVMPAWKPKPFETIEALSPGDDQRSIAEKKTKSCQQTSTKEMRPCVAQPRRGRAVDALRFDAALHFFELISSAAVSGRVRKAGDSGPEVCGADLVRRPPDFRQPEQMMWK